jgi:hypothetical protein
MALPNIFELLEKAIHTFAYDGKTSKETIFLTWYHMHTKLQC